MYGLPYHPAVQALEVLRSEANVTRLKAPTAESPLVIVGESLMRGCEDSDREE